MIPILTAAFNSSFARFLNETGILYGVMTFVGLAFSDLSDIFISGTFIVGSSWVVHVLNAEARNMPWIISSAFSCASSGHSVVPGAILKTFFVFLTSSSIALNGGSSSLRRLQSHVKFPRLSSFWVFMQKSFIFCDWCLLAPELMFPLVILLVWTLEMCSVPNIICPAWLMKCPWSSSTSCPFFAHTTLSSNVFSGMYPSS